MTTTACSRVTTLLGFLLITSGIQAYGQGIFHCDQLTHQMRVNHQPGKIFQNGDLCELDGDAIVSVDQNPQLNFGVFVMITSVDTYFPMENHAFGIDDVTVLSGNASILDEDCSFNVPVNSTKPAYYAMVSVYVVDGLSGETQGLDPGVLFDTFARAQPGPPGGGN